VAEPVVAEHIAVHPTTIERGEADAPPVQELELELEATDAPLEGGGSELRREVA